MAEINQFCSDPITCYAQSGASDRLALSPNNNLVHIYRQQQSSWIEESILSKHDLRITSIDWAAKSDRIVTCSADRNAYVWLREPGSDVWTPTLVFLRINRAATCVKWSPNEDKFAVGTAAKLICVCYFESANNWWVSKHIKKPIKSTVTSLDWHPNNIFIACGSTDYKSRIFSTYMKEVDAINPDANENQLRLSSWTKNRPDLTEPIAATGTLINEFSNSGAWVHDVSFSPDGTRLAWVSHDSCISVVDSTKGMTYVTLKTRYLPFLGCVWVSQASIVAAGHDCCPMLFNYQSIDNSPVLRFIGRLDRSQKKEQDGQSAMRKFKNLDAKSDTNNTNSNHNQGARAIDTNIIESIGINNSTTNTNSSPSVAGDSCLGTIHQNTISQVRLYSKQNSVATVGMDGKLVVWSLDASVL